MNYKTLEIIVIETNKFPIRTKERFWLFNEGIIKLCARKVFLDMHTNFVATERASVNGNGILVAVFDFGEQWRRSSTRNVMMNDHSCMRRQITAWTIHLPGPMWSIELWNQILQTLTCALTVPLANSLNGVLPGMLWRHGTSGAGK